MQNALTNLLTQLAGMLGPLSPFTKAVVPGGLALAVAVVNSLFAGSINTVSITVAASGLGLALVAYLVPNVAKAPKPVPAPKLGK